MQIGYAKVVPADQSVCQNLTSSRMPLRLASLRALNAVKEKGQYDEACRRNNDGA